MNITNSLHAAIRYSHIGVGMVGLLLFWIPVFAKKGSKLHIRCGRIFVWCGYYIAATAAISCTWGLISPVSFAGVKRELTSEQLAALNGNIRFLFAILGTLMTWLLASLIMGMHAVKTRLKSNTGSWRVKLGFALSGTASGGLLLFGLTNAISGGGNAYFIPIVLGILGVVDCKTGLAYLKLPSATKMTWWYVHMECMLGSGVAFHTAFFVFGFSRLFGIQLNGPLALVPWLLPTAVGIPTIVIWTKYYRRKFGEEEGKVVEGVGVSGGAEVEG